MSDQQQEQDYLDDEGTNFTADEGFVNSVDADDDDDFDDGDGDDDLDDDIEALDDDEVLEESDEPEEDDDALEAKAMELQSSEALTTAALLKAKVIYTCPVTRKIFYRNKWIKDNITDLYTVKTEMAICDKYLDRAREVGLFIGSIEIYDKNLKERKESMLDFARGIERDLEGRMPFEVIIDVSEKNDILYIFTNTTRLALEIARGIRYEFGGSIQYEWFERNQYIRAKWFSEIQNREYFKSRIRAAKENRIGMFSFEDR
ncbi:MAG: hypothetical protein H6628_12410 [Calditrichae bacterium]|nr:hypothetical protein [Calditrichota bacterium]MCB0297114.1 hypothetical protein [Calditrichota bacterium]MCB0312151.1 hypothetical protein [Calditrichota bacterium]MCB9089102.1 hypothetical protein [Calditrichia bacterium]